jgi:hypothetical protein
MNIEFGSDTNINPTFNLQNFLEDSLNTINFQLFYVNINMNNNYRIFTASQKTQHFHC